MIASEAAEPAAAQNRVNLAIIRLEKEVSGCLNTSVRPIFASFRSRLLHSLMQRSWSNQEKSSTGAIAKSSPTTNLVPLTNTPCSRDLTESSISCKK